MSIQVRILNASGKLTSHKDSIQKTVQKAIKKVRHKISLDNIDIVIREADNPKSLVDLDGIGAYCPSGYFVQLSIDVNHPSFDKSPEKLIKKSLVHELHHAARRQAGIKIDKGTFLECVFSEGLADYFVYEIIGDLPKWIIEIKDKNRSEIIQRFKKVASKKMTTQDYEDWFIAGSRKHKIPRWTGYALGFEIVKNFLEKNTEKTASSLVAVPVEEIFTVKNKEQYIR